MTDQENVALIEKLYEAFSKGDIEFILDHLTDDVRWSSPGPASIPYSGERTGSAQVRDFFERLGSTQENVNLTTEKFIAQNDAVATLGRYAATVRATGKPLDAAIAHFFTIRDGKVSRWVGFEDTAHAVEAYTP